MGFLPPRDESFLIVPLSFLKKGNGWMRLGGCVKLRRHCRKRGLRLISSALLLCRPLVPLLPKLFRAGPAALERGNTIPGSDGVSVGAFRCLTFLHDGCLEPDGCALPCFAELSGIVV